MKTKKLNRDSNSRVALFKSLLTSLVRDEEIKTTYAKAVVVRSMADKMISKAISGDMHSRRLVQGDLQNQTLLRKLFSDIAPRFKNKKGGYTKVTMIGTRKGDNARIAKLALTIKAAPVAVAKDKKVVAEPKKDTVARKAAPVVKGKASTPKVAKPTATPKVVASSVGKVRKAGER